MNNKIVIDVQKILTSLNMMTSLHDLVNGSGHNHGIESGLPSSPLQSLGKSDHVFEELHP